MATTTITCRHCGNATLQKYGIGQTASKSIVVAPADDKVATTRNPPAIRLSNGKRYFEPIKSAVDCLDLKEHSVLCAIPSEKDHQRSQIADTPIALGPTIQVQQPSNLTKCGHLRCENESALGLAGELSKNTTSRGLRDGRPQ